jgi:hypothetical protein
MISYRLMRPFNEIRIVTYNPSASGLRRHWRGWKLLIRLIYWYAIFWICSIPFVASAFFSFVKLPLGGFAKMARVVNVVFITRGHKSGQPQTRSCWLFYVAYERTVSLLKNCYNRVAVAEHLTIEGWRGTESSLQKWSDSRRRRSQL